MPWRVDCSGFGGLTLSQIKSYRKISKTQIVYLRLTLTLIPGAIKLLHLCRSRISSCPSQAMFTNTPSFPDSSKVLMGHEWRATVLRHSLNWTHCPMTSTVTCLWTERCIRGIALFWKRLFFEVASSCLVIAASSIKDSRLLPIKPDAVPRLFLGLIILWLGCLVEGGSPKLVTAVKGASEVDEVLVSCKWKGMGCPIAYTWDWGSNSYTHGMSCGKKHVRGSWRTPAEIVGPAGQSSRIFMSSSKSFHSSGVDFSVERNVNDCGNDGRAGLERGI